MIRIDSKYGYYHCSPLIPAQLNWREKLGQSNRLLLCLRVSVFQCLQDLVEGISVDHCPGGIGPFERLFYTDIGAPLARPYGVLLGIVEALLVGQCSPQPHGGDICSEVKTVLVEVEEAGEQVAWRRKDTCILSKSAFVRSGSISQ